MFKENIEPLIGTKFDFATWNSKEDEKQRRLTRSLVGFRKKGNAEEPTQSDGLRDISKPPLICPRCFSKYKSEEIKQIDPFVTDNWMRCPYCGEFATFINGTWFVVTPPY